jgi:hypothetical protein
LVYFVVSSEIWQTSSKFVIVLSLDWFCFAQKKEQVSTQVTERFLVKTLLELVQLANAGLWWISDWTRLNPAEWTEALQVASHRNSVV